MHKVSVNLLSNQVNEFWKNINNLQLIDKNRLLTPEEGCGYAKVGKTKIVGGKSTKPGTFKWIEYFKNCKKWRKFCELFYF